jgi:hypothetical protein
MILTEKDITERLVGLDLPPSIKEAIQNGLKGVPVISHPRWLPTTSTLKWSHARR